KPQSGLKENNWKDAHESLFNFYGPKRLMSWYPKTQRIRVQKIAFDSLETNYNWDKNSLLLNLTCNPINRWRADDMLTKYIELEGSSDLVELCAEILANDPNNEYLLEALLNKYGENAGKDLKKYQSLMSKARVPINLRKSMSLELFPDKDWLQLGPINLEENKTELLQKPEENFNLSAFKLSNKKELKFEAPRDNGKDYEGLMYLRKDFNSSSSSNVYLHIKPESRRSAFNNLRIWHNGKVLSDTVVNTGRNQTTTLKIPLRKGKNSLLIKYSFEHYTNLKLRLGNVYGADLSYIKPIKILPDTIVSSSSEEIAYLKTSNVFDGNLETRWSSKFEFPQYLSLKLPRSINIKDIEIFWEAAYAKKYTISVSENGIDWKLVYTKEGKKTKDNDQISCNNFHVAKYVRFDFLEKGSQYGASIYEIKLNKKFLHEVVPSFIKSEISYNSNSVKLN
ncbi:MAG: discoidin domain-containing protein, partial [Lentisphaerales bacterium]|nr:discoidin domain-containing protein [Lentisphaerales bacterium]